MRSLRRARGYRLVVAEILLAASAEMAEAAAWYDERVSGLGERFLGEAEAAFHPRRRDTANRCTLESSAFAGWCPAHLPTVISVFRNLHSRAEACDCRGSASSPTARILGEAFKRDLAVVPGRFGSGPAFA